VGGVSVSWFLWGVDGDVVFFFFFASVWAEALDCESRVVCIVGDYIDLFGIQV